MMTFWTAIAVTIVASLIVSAATLDEGGEEEIDPVIHGLEAILKKFEKDFRLESIEGLEEVQRNMNNWCSIIKGETSNRIRAIQEKKRDEATKRRLAEQPKISDPSLRKMIEEIETDIEDKGRIIDAFMEVIQISRKVQKIDQTKPVRLVSHWTTKEDYAKLRADLKNLFRALLTEVQEENRERLKKVGPLQRK